MKMRQGHQNRRFARLNSVGMGALLSLGVATMAHAAEPAPAPADNSNQVGEVVVTAQFRSQDLQTTPLAITAVNSDMLRARSQTNVATVAQASPGLNLTTGSLGGAQTTQISIRGIGQRDFNLAVEPGVGMYIDDVYYGTMFGALFDLVDTDRVEILRGPQGTLSGKNSEGGAVKLYSKKPTDSNSAYIESTFGNFSRREVRAGANYTIVPDKLFVRITGIGEFEKGYVKSYDYQCRNGKNPVSGSNPLPSFALNPPGFGGNDSCLLSREGGKNLVGLRASLRWTPNEKIDDVLTYDDMHDRADPPPLVTIAQGTGWAAPGTGAPVANFAVPYGSYYNYATYCGLVGTPQSFCVKPQSALDSWGLSNNLDIKVNDNVSLKSISAFRQFSQQSVTDGDNSPLSTGQNSWNLHYKQYSQEVRLSAKLNDMIQFTVGGFYFKSDAEQGARVSIDSLVNTAGVISYVPFDFLEFDPVKVTSKSLFGHLEVTPTDRLTLTAGIRYTDDSKFFQYGRALAPGYAGSFLDGSVTPLNGTNGTFSGSRVDYRFTADYKFTKDISVYVQTATGYKGGGFSPRPFYPQQAVPFGPEVDTDYEIGLKSYLFDRRVRMNISAYYNKYDSLQLQLSYCPDFAPQTIPILNRRCAMNANVGNADIKGFEAETEIHPVRNALIDASVSYIDFVYTSLDTPTLKTGIRLTDKPVYVPAWKFNIGAQYKYEIGKAGSFTPRFDVSYLDKQQTNLINNPAAVIKAYMLVNARLTWENGQGDWSVALEATNLLDKYYAVVQSWGLPPAINASPLTGSATEQPGRPRMVAVTVRKTF